MIVNSLDKLNLPKEVDLTGIFYNIAIGINYYNNGKGEVSVENFNHYIKNNGSNEKYYTEGIFRMIDKYYKIILISMKKSKRRDGRNEF